MCSKSFSRDLSKAQKQRLKIVIAVLQVAIIEDGISLFNVRLRCWIGYSTNKFKIAVKSVKVFEDEVLRFSRQKGLDLW